MMSYLIVSRSSIKLSAERKAWFDKFGEYGLKEGVRDA
jgi:hypothetical protein